MLRAYVLTPILAGLLLGLAGCSGEDSSSTDTTDKGTEENAPVDGKADSFFNPTEHGDLTFGVPAQATFNEADHFHSWTFTLTGEADVAVSSPNDTPNLDTVMYLYRRDPGASSWGRYVERNDDYDGNIWSRVSGTFEAGEYRVVVKAYKTALHGTFKLDGTCEGDGCPGNSSGNCPDIEAEVTTTDVTQACVNTYASVLTSALLSESRYDIEYPQHCSLSGPERVAVEQYYAYWDGLVGWGDLVYEEDEVVSFEVAVQKLEKGSVVEVDFGGDEMALYYVFDENDALVMYYHSEQSPMAYWICNDGGPAIEEPDIDCVSGAIHDMPHDTEDETVSDGTATVSEARETLSFLSAFALDAYQNSTGIADDAAVTYEAHDWTPSEYGSVALVRFEAAGQPVVTYGVGGSESWAHIYWAQSDGNTEMVCLQVGD